MRFEDFTPRERVVLRDALYDMAMSDSRENEAWSDVAYELLMEAKPGGVNTAEEEEAIEELNRA